MTEIILLTPDFWARGETEGRGDFPFSSMVSSARGEKASLREEEEGNTPLREEREGVYLYALLYKGLGRKGERAELKKHSFLPRPCRSV